MPEYFEKSLSSAGKKIKTFCVFQGGGARGVYHLGLMRSLDSMKKDPNYPELDIRGVAGTSIGALMAALVAVGFPAKEMFDMEKGVIPICEDRNIRIPENLLSRGGWKIIRLHRFLFNLLNSLFSVIFRRFDAIGLFALIFIFISMSVMILIYFYNEFGGMAVLFMILIFLSIVTGYITYLMRGISNFKKFNEFLDEVLVYGYTRYNKNLPGNIELKDGLRFHHLENINMKLRIVATDASREKMKLFSEKLTPQEKIADVVCASMAVPVVCKAVVVSGKRYFDGGLVSNTPAWTFDTEMLIDPDAILVTSEIPKSRELQRLYDEEDGEESSIGKKHSKKKYKTSPISTMYRMLMASLFGTTDLQVRPTDRFIRVRMNPINIGLLSFDMGKQKMREAVQMAEVHFDYSMDLHFKMLPDIWDSVIKRAEGYFEMLSERSGNINKPQFRCSVAYPMDRHKALKVRYNSDQNRHPHRRLDDRTVYTDDTIASQAFWDDKIRLELKPKNKFQDLSQRRNRYRLALMEDAVEWALYVPAGDRSNNGDPLALLIICCDRPIDEFGLANDTDLPGPPWSYAQAVLRDIAKDGATAEKETRIKLEDGSILYSEKRRNQTDAVIQPSNK